MFKATLQNYINLLFSFKIQNIRSKCVLRGVLSLCFINEDNIMVLCTFNIMDVGLGTKSTFDSLKAEILYSGLVSIIFIRHPVYTQSAIPLTSHPPSRLRLIVPDQERDTWSLRDLINSSYIDKVPIIPRRYLEIISFTFIFPLAFRIRDAG